MENSSPNEKKSDPTFLYSALDNYGGYPFQGLFDFTIPVYKPEDMVSQRGCLVLWGGADISPSIYGQTVGSKTYAPKEPSSKDQLELNLIGRAIKLGIPILGICRGAQIMCAIAGGSLVQDVRGHGKDHFIKTDEGQTLKATSLHHQMMFPWSVSHKLIAWSSPPLSPEYTAGFNAETKEDDPVIFPETVTAEMREPEIVYFPEVKALAIQGHPEFIHNSKHEFVAYSNRLVNQYLIAPFLT